MTAPKGLQLDLLTAVQRLRQVREEITHDGSTERGGQLLARVIMWDLPRLEGQLTAETRDWAARQPFDPMHDAAVRLRA